MPPPAYPPTHPPTRLPTPPPPTKTGFQGPSQECPDNRHVTQSIIEFTSLRAMAPPIPFHTTHPLQMF
jgi:hypothetical protein